MSATDKQIPDVREVAEGNPGVEPEKVERVHELVEELKRRGARRREYDVASPYVRRPLERRTSPYG